MPNSKEEKQYLTFRGTYFHLAELQEDWQLASAGKEIKKIEPLN